MNKTIPGVYTTEIDQSTYVRNASNLSIGCVGEATYGPIGTPQFISDEGQFIDTFGQPNADCIGMYGALMYLKSGNKLWYSRVCPTLTAGKAGGDATFTISTDVLLTSKLGLVSNVADEAKFFPRLALNLKYAAAGSSGNKTISLYYKGVKVESIIGADTAELSTLTSNFIQADDSSATQPFSDITNTAVKEITIPYDFTVPGTKWYSTVSKASALIALATNPTVASGTTTSFYIPAFVLVAKYAGTAGNSIGYVISNIKTATNGANTYKTFTIAFSRGNNTESFRNISADDKAKLATGVTHLSDVISTIVDIVTLDTYTAALAVNAEIVDTHTATAPLVGGVEGTGTVGTFKFATPLLRPFNVGETVLITNALPATYNGLKAVITSDTTQITFACTETVALTRGTVTATVAETPFLSGTLEGGMNGTVAESGFSRLQQEFSAEIIGDETEDTGIRAFHNTTDYNIGVLIAPKYSAFKSIAAALAEVCETRADCMFILDPPEGLKPAEVVAWSNGTY